MDHESLRTASNYLNNLLLARGLLRNGDAIDFVKPSKDSRASIINLVHDLILREDREKESRENVAVTIRQFRTEDTRKAQEIESLRTKSDQSARNAAQAQQAERVANAEVKKVEKAMKALQDQVAKLKTTLAQVKTQCANDVKKRDLELQRLKTHLQGQQRGTRVGMTAPSMTVRKHLQEPAQDVNDPAYSLKQETTEFLTQLSQNLSDENDGLISLVRSALSTMNELLGIQANAQRQVDSAIGSMGSDQASKSKTRNAGNNLLQQAPETTYEALASDLERTLEHLKTILTNPNFVSLEEFEKEVETRDDEIDSLREGWEHMEQRWREVLGMMQGWAKRMNTGDTINIDDLRKGMGLVTPNRRGEKKRKVEPVPEESETEPSMMESETSEIQLPSSEVVDTAPTTAPTQQQSSLSASDGMRSLTSKLDNLASPKRKRDALEPPDMFDFRPAETSKTSRSAAGRSPQGKTSRLASTGLADVFSPVGKSSSRHATREPTSEPVLGDDGEESEELEVPQMTIQEKLHAAQEEAEQAVAASGCSMQPAANGTSRTSKSRRQNISPDYGLDGTTDALPGDDTLGKLEGDDTLGKMDLGGSPMAKKTRIKGRPKKRKSTLTRDEMASLLVLDDEPVF
ncbi:Putative afadin/alpha-actinin-binding protein [Septoria linicola]|uniref:Afadin/alpha-actinin-binding protein n=1 Tax=Septoria linicola TaxID=215465 RepID=A0A9Q9EKW1_9PEZI|nr:putative afadin/alpha-actinin-binding protein [Septoria linicola]USW53717.1 Putative afadin/alpha-actinin-binding protein [Septoria linicola]